MNRQIAILRTVVWQSNLAGVLLILGFLGFAYALAMYWQGLPLPATHASWLIGFLALSAGAGCYWYRWQALVGGLAAREARATLPYFRDALLHQLVAATALLVALPTLAMLTISWQDAWSVFVWMVLVALAATSLQRLNRIFLCSLLLAVLYAAAVEYGAITRSAASSETLGDIRAMAGEFLVIYALPAAVIFELGRLLLSARHVFETSSGARVADPVSNISRVLERELGSASEDFGQKRGKKTTAALRMLGFGLLNPGLAGRSRWIILGLGALLLTLLPTVYAVAFGCAAVAVYFFLLGDALRRSVAEQEACRLLPHIGGEAFGRHMLGFVLWRMSEPLALYTGAMALLVVGGRMQVAWPMLAMVGLILASSAMGVLYWLNQAERRTFTGVAPPITLPIVLLTLLVVALELTRQLGAARGAAPWILLFALSVAVLGLVLCARRLLRQPLPVHARVR